MPLHGDSQTFSIAAICRMIHAEKKSGCLKVEKSGRHAGIHFREGNINSLENGGFQALSIEELLRTGRHIAPEGLDRALQEAQTRGRPLARILLESKRMDPQKLAAVYYQQFRELLAEVLLWPRSEYTYTEGSLSPEAPLPLKIDPVRLFADAQKWMRFRKLIPSDRTVLQIRDRSRLQDFTEREAASRIVLLIDGRRDVSQLIVQTGFTRAAAYRLMAAMVSQGIVAANGPPPTPDAGADQGAFLSFYRQVMQYIAQDLIPALGSAKTGHLLNAALQRTPCNNSAAGSIDLEAGTEKVLAAFWQRIQQNCLARPGAQWEPLLHSIVCALLQETYLLLGARACHNLIDRILQWLARTPEMPARWVPPLKDFLQDLKKNENILQGAKNMVSPAPGTSIPASTGKIAATTGGSPVAELVALYSDALTFVMQDLRTELGNRAESLLQEVLRQSPFQKAFPSPGGIPPDLAQMLAGIRHDLSRRLPEIDPGRIAENFHQVLGALVKAQKSLLGRRPAENTVSALGEFFHERGQPPADALFAALHRIVREG